MAVYRPTNVQQLDGSRFAGVNCTYASAATALDRHTSGRKKSTGAKMRYYSGDTSGGGNLNQADTAWHRGYNEDLDVRYMMPWNDAVAMLRDRGFILQLRYSYLKTSYRDFRCQSSFFGNHALYVNEAGTMRHPSTGATIAAGLTYDPLCGSNHWVPLSVLKLAASKLRFPSGNTVGTGYCYIGLTRRTAVSGTTPAPGLPPTPVEVNPMIPGGGLVRTSSHVKALREGQALYRTPNGRLATRMSEAAKVEYFGTAGPGWHCVEVHTGAPYADGVKRPTLLYVPATAGAVSKKA